MKRKNLALRMSACMMSALLTVSSVTPAFAAEDITFEDQAADAAEETVAEPEEVQETADQGEAQSEEAADVELESDAADTEAADSEELFADDFSNAADDSAAVFADETAAAQTGFGTANTQLAAGTYQVTVSLKKADKAQDGVYVSMFIDVMNCTQDAFLNADYANAEKEATVDTSALEATIAQADALDEMAYTKESWDGNKDAIEAAKTAAKAALEAKESQEAVDAANTVLADAMSKLVAAGDSAELQAAVDQAKALKETDYTVKSVKANWSKIQDNIAAAENAIAGRETDKNLASIKNNLSNAIKGLSKAYNTENLEKLISKAEALKESDYTADSWKDAKLSLAIASAKDVIAARGNKNNVHTAMEAIENAMDKLVADGIVVGRGNFAKKLKPGTYSVPIELLHSARAESTNDYTSADYMTQLSMAHGCFTGKATIVIHEDGTATLTTGVQAIKAMGTEGAASDWTIYEDTQGFLDGTVNSSNGVRYYARVDESKVQAGKKKPSKISFTIPDLKQNVVVSRMKIEVMNNIQQDACIGIDWANIEKVSDETSATSAVEKSYVIAPDTLTQLKNIKAGDVVKLDQDITLTEDISVKGGTMVLEYK